METIGRTQVVKTDLCQKEGSYWSLKIICISLQFYRCLTKKSPAGGTKILKKTINEKMVNDKVRRLFLSGALTGSNPI
jgi:hypothetical protein